MRLFFGCQLQKVMVVCGFRVYGFPISGEGCVRARGCVYVCLFVGLPGLCLSVCLSVCLCVCARFIKYLVVPQDCSTCLSFWLWCLGLFTGSGNFASRVPG